jgi:hypothetical protein
LLAGFFGVRGVLVARAVTVHEDGCVDVHRVVTVILDPAEIPAIVPRRPFRPFLVVTTTPGRMRVPDEWTGLHSSVRHLRRRSPALRLTRVPGE